MNVVVLVSGRGSNLEVLVREAATGALGQTKIVATITDNPEAAALTFAQARGLPFAVVSPKSFANRAEWNGALADTVAAFHPDLVVFAGFMRLVDANFLSRFPRRVINIHPSLLPAFPGKDGVGLALAHGARVSGCTVHLVDEGTDTGSILGQAAVPVYPGDTSAQLHARIQRAEHALFPRIVGALAEGVLQLSPSVQWKAPLDQERIQPGSLSPVVMFPPLS